MSMMGARCTICNTYVCCTCTMRTRSSVYVPFGTSTSTHEHMRVWLLSANQTFLNTLAHKLMTMNVESGRRNIYSIVMQYFCLFANGLVLPKFHGLTSSLRKPLADQLQVPLIAEIDVCEHNSIRSECIEGCGKVAAVLDGKQEEMHQNVLLRLLELLQLQDRLKLQPMMHLLARNYLTKNLEQSRAVHVIFSAFLYHCALLCPTLEQLKEEAKLHVLECFEISLSMILEPIFKDRAQAHDIIVKMAERAEFLMTTTNPAIVSASTAHGNQMEKLEDKPLFLNSFQPLGAGNTPFSGKTGLVRAKSEHLTRRNNTAEHKIGRFLSESNLPSAQLNFLLTAEGRKRGEERREESASLQSASRSAHKLWRKVRQRTSIIGFFAVFIAQRKRKHVAQTVRRFCLNDQGVSLVQVQQVVVDVEKCKISATDSLNICTLLCSSGGYSGAQLDSFRTLCLGTLCRTWQTMLDGGVCDHLEVQLREFLLTNCTVILSEEEKTLAVPRARFSPGLYSVGVASAVLQRTPAGITSIMGGTWHLLLRLCNSEHTPKISEPSSNSSDFHPCGLCWQARASVMVVVLTVVEKIVAHEGELPIVELRAIFTSLVDCVVTWATQSNPSLAFGLGALSHLFQPLRERSEEFHDMISEGVRKMMLLLGATAVMSHGTRQLQAFMDFLGALVCLLQPMECDQIILLIIEKEDESPSKCVGVEALKQLPDDPEAGLAFLYWLAALGRLQYNSYSATAVSRMFSLLSQELDQDGIAAWWTPLLRFLRLHSTAASPGSACADESEVPSTSVGVNGGELISLEVLGGKMAFLTTGSGVDLKDGRTGVIVQFCKLEDKVWVALSDSSLYECEVKSLYFKSPYTGRLGPQSLDVLLPWVFLMKDHLFRRTWSHVDVASSEQCESDTKGPASTHSTEIRRMMWQLRVLKALVEHSASYDGFGDSSAGEFTTKGAQEMAETLDKHHLLLPILQLALSADVQQDVRWAVGALEESVAHLELRAEELAQAAGRQTGDYPLRGTLLLRLQYQAR